MYWRGRPIPEADRLAQIRIERNAYYDILENTQKGSCDVTAWQQWFLNCLLRAHEGDWLLGPVAEIVGPERLAIYHQTLAGLTRSEQELVLMRFEFGLSFAEMALEVGSTAEAVRKRLARILLSMAMSHGVEHEKSS